MGPGHMGARRDPSTPSISCLPRDSLHTSNSAAIDSALKELKTTSRRLKTIISFFHDELNILERLYYKGKNQHRSALFWKRVVELKRFAERLNGMNVSNTLEQMRCSFFGITSTTNSKNLRGSWTHVPHSAYVFFVLERMSACLTLVFEFNVKIIVIARSFKLAMQSGAFIQLALTLAAVAARTMALLPEIQDALQVSWAAGHTILQVLDHGLSERTKPEVFGPTTETETVFTRKPSPDEVNPDEDQGSFVPRSTQFGTRDAPCVPELITIEWPTIPDEPVDHAVAMFDKPVGSTLPAPPPVRTNPGRSGIEAAAPVAKKPKKRKKKDEIDDIFGF